MAEGKRAIDRSQFTLSWLTESSEGRLGTSCLDFGCDWVELLEVVLERWQWTR